MPAISDYDDPCIVVAALKQAYYALLQGEQAQTVEFQSGDGSMQHVIYHKTDLELLRTEISRLTVECREQTTGKVKRYALRAGGF